MRDVPKPMLRKFSGAILLAIACADRTERSNYFAVCENVNDQSSLRVFSLALNVSRYRISYSWVTILFSFIRDEMRVVV